MKILATFVLAALLVAIFVSASPPELPTLIYGKVGYQDEGVLEGEKVTFRWYKNGEETEDSTKTLTTEEADSLGDKSLAGYYSFQINSLDSSSVVISSAGKTINVIVSQGDVVTADIILDKKDFISNAIDFFSGIISGGNYSNESSGGDSEVDVPSHEEPTEKFSGKEESDNYYGGNFQGQEPSESSSATPYDKSIKTEVQEQKEVSGSFFESVYLFSLENRIVFFFLGIILLSSTLLILISGIKFSRKIIKKRREKMIIPLKKMTSTPTKRFMEKDMIVLDSEDSILDAIDLFVKNNLAIIPVVNGKELLGVLTKKDLLQKTSKEDFDSLEKIKIKKLAQKRFVSRKPRTKMADIYTLLLQHKLGAILITNGEKLIGAVDYFDILRVFNKLNIEVENPPILSQVMSGDFVTVSHSTKLYQVLNALILKDSEYALITEDGNLKGIITTKDLISAKQKNLDFKRTLAINVMSTHLITMTPGTSLNEAFNLVLERKFNQIPIVMDNKVIGVVTVKYLVKAYYDLLLELNKKRGK